MCSWIAPEGRLKYNIPLYMKNVYLNLLTRVEIIDLDIFSVITDLHACIMYLPNVLCIVERNYEENKLFYMYIPHVMKYRVTLS